ncbi:C-C motif chemokine 25b [Alosa alosa]|uniref:C-C motif chemokine 25b n=1 Tax=Alosa alosa TaxID=278164 RepID=UPI00201552BB|nr:C-C motif chemokine 25b [Alosa alosa]
MQFSILFFVLILACMCPSLAQGSYENCCLKYVTGVKKSTKRRVEKYRVQETDGGCNIPAVVFTLKNKKSFCANPEQTWVKQLITEVKDRKNKKMKNTQSKM